MADIKTRDAVKGTIKTIDKAAIATERMKSAYAKTKDEPLPVFVTSAGFIDMEVMAQDANKGAILLELAERLHIRTDEILAIGDSENDVAMLQTAGVGVAMGNAKEHVREIADVVAPDNEHDGVAWTVERVLRGDFDGIG